MDRTPSSTEHTPWSQERSSGDYSSSDLKAFKEDDDHSEARRFKLFFALALLFMVLGVLAMAGLVVAHGVLGTRRSQSTEAGPTGIMGGLKDKELGPILPRLSDIEGPRNPRKTDVDASATSTSAGEGTGPDHSDVVTFAPGKRSLSRSLICTVGRRLNPTVVFPPDGLCDFIFFDSLHNNGTNKLGGESSPNFIYFKENAMRYNVTTFGVGLDIQSCSEVEEFLSSDNASSTLRDLIQDGIHHYGVINTEVAPMWLAEVKKALSVLKAIDSLIQHEVRENRPLYTALTAAPYSEALLHNFTTLFKTVFTPDMIILYGHFFAEDQSWPDCQIVPPTFETKPESGAYIYSLETAHDNAQELQRAGLPAHTVAISVAMFGRWYKSRRENDSSTADQPADNVLFGACEQTGRDEQLGSVTEVCQMPTWSSRIHSEEHRSEYCYGGDGEMIFTFDTAETLREKLCSQKRRVPSVHYALAAFNLEYADGRGECGEGDFAELRVLRRLVDDDLSDGVCGAVQPSSP